MSQNKLYLFSSKSCPYAHRCEISIKLLNLENQIEIVYCDPIFTFKDKWKIVGSNNPSPFEYLKDLYEYTNCKNRVSLPTLYDNSKGQIISSDSIEIIKIMCRAATSYKDFVIEDPIFYKNFNEKFAIGTYVTGHAKTTEDYQRNYEMVFEYLDWLNNYLDAKDFALGDKLTMTDVILYCHLIRFDIVFYNLFSLNKKHLWEYQHILRYLQNLRSIQAIHDATDIDEIKRGGYLTENNLPQNLGYTKVPIGLGGAERYL